MLDAIIKKLKQLTVEPVPFDPSSLNDEIALKTSWEPAKGGGSNFQTHRLVEIDLHRTEFRGTVGLVLFAGLFTLIGLFVPSVFVFVALQEQSGVFDLIFPVVIGLIFAGVGGSLLWFGLAPVVFDKRRGEFWRGRTAPYEAANRDSLKHYAKLEDVRAIQLVSELCRSKNSRYYSYELNLVLEDGTRLNVTDHGNLKSLRSDAERLSAFLGKPVWDATGR
jgi:hypothetical protein